MKRPSLLRLSDDALLREFSARLARNHADCAELLAYLAEIDRRRLYRPAGYSSMYKYCVGHFHFSEAAAYKRIHAARLIRKYPKVYDALAEGRVHLSGLVLLVKYLRPENVDELLVATTHKSRRHIEELIAERFPKPDVPTTIVEIRTEQAASTAPSLELASGGVPESASTSDGRGSSPTQMAAGDLVIPAPCEPAQAQAPAPTSVDRPIIRALSPKRYAVQFTMDEATHGLLVRAQELLGHLVAGDVPAVLSRALEAYVALLERRKFGATSAPKAMVRKAATRSRHIPAHVMRAVWKRDRGQCTFVSDAGHRCEERSGLEFDHVLEYARGGEATVNGIRLRCRAHNQFQAELTFGQEFMRHKRERAMAASSREKQEQELSPGRVFDAGVTAAARGA